MSLHTIKTWFRLLSVVTSTLLLWTLTSCTSDTCEEAYDKMSSCVEKLNCNKLDPTYRSKCESSRQKWEQYKNKQDVYLLACSHDSELQQEADKVASCALDPRTCTCP